ncbi:hypothetical protein KVF89_06645 [Nocardioides carbamazepini]|uniref:hypothetical protein n=1 Tax=Nocardioides carbamazepini TaxID=2854259 RepID=UPI002149A4BE|nr:hypothetical protein [Nocardioides carbamazepini]MCR1782205.1 hypothetical protein [Nocardioides carbamazepini]
MSQKQHWRFALRIVDGPNAGLGAGSWRLWVHRDEVYISAANQINTIKVSLHDSDKWRVAYTAEHMAQEQPLWSRKADRAPWKFDAPPFVDGVQEAFVVAAVRAALTPNDVDERETVVAIEDRWDRVSGVRIIISEPNIAVAARELVFPAPLTLKNGRLVWLSSFQEPVDAIEPEPVPAGSLVRVLTPKTNGVSCPGYLLVGVNLA